MRHSEVDGTFIWRCDRHSAVGTNSMWHGEVWLYHHLQESWVLNTPPATHNISTYSSGTQWKINHL